MSSLFIRLRHAGLHRPRLLVAAGGGAAVWLLLPAGWPPAARALAAWNIALWPYLLSMGWLMLGSPPQRVRAIAQQEDASSAALLAVMSAAALASLLGIVMELARARDGGQGALFAFGLPLATVAGSWLLLGVVYTFHYAHLYYQAPASQRPLQFPDKLDMPSYRDFLYFSFTISAAAQTSDVTVMSTRMRGVVLAQTVLSFFFNVAILGLSINIAAGVVGPH